MFLINEAIQDTFVEIDLQTGLVAGDFSATLIRNGSISAVPVTISEVIGAAGFYAASFTPDQVGDWSLDIIVTAKPNTRYQKTYRVTESILDLEVGDSSLGDYINRIKKYTTNKVTRSANTYTVMEDDGVTVFESGVSTSTERSPNP